jgi:fumarate hydratase class II
MNTRTEYDSLGPVEVPCDRYFGAQTQRALGNFDVGTERFPPAFIRAHVLVKKAAAAVNAALGQLEPRVAGAIAQAADEALTGCFDDNFPLTIWQSGSGTQTNMNVNEVLASRANELLGGQRGDRVPVHPNDHVNRGQSTNDAVPTSMHIAAVLALRDSLLPALDALHASLARKRDTFADIVKVGRTHLQDATPLTLGQEFSGYAAQVAAARADLDRLLGELSALPIGGTAVGTGVNTVEGFDTAMAAELSRLTGAAFRVQANKFAGMAAHDAVVRLSGSLRALGAALMKIANDLRWMGSGPRSGIGELVLPPNEPGSSIMPGKVNPTQCEMLTMIVCQVYGNDTAIAMAGSQGHFELNVFKPLLAAAILQSIGLLADGCRSFAARCVDGIQPDRRRIRRHLENSLMLVTALSPHIGYDAAARIALAAHREDRGLREAALASGLVSAEQYDAWVRPENMLHPHPRNGA